MKKRLDLILFLYFVATFSIWIMTLIHIGRNDNENSFVFIFILSILSYLLFTPVHEASHGHFSRYKWINYIIGFLSSFAQGPLNSYSGYRELHLTHHGNTNDPKSDPDMWCAPGKFIPLLLRWATTDLYYLYFYSIRMFNYSMIKNIKINLEMMIQVGLFIYLIMIGYAYEAIIYWLIPSRLVVFALSFTFNYLPHSPYILRNNSKSEDEYTRNIKQNRLLFSILFMGHNFHEIHHSNLSLPFYKYASEYFSKRDV